MNCCFRPFRVDDAAVVKVLAGDYEVACTTLNIPHPYEDGMAEGWIAGHGPALETGESVTWAMAVQRTGTLVGAISISLDGNHQRGELGYWVGRRYWRNGFATQAAQAIVSYGFEQLELHRIQAHHFASNPASGRVMQKAGMRCEGTLRQMYRRFGAWHDICFYAILRSELE